MLTLNLLAAADLPVIAAAFAALGWDKPLTQYETYLAEQEGGLRTVLVARWAGEFAGYVTLLWQPSHPALAVPPVPEIADFNVLPQFRRRGIGSALLDEAERRAAEVSPLVALGVGLTADYGAALRLYVRRGYLPVGSGLFSYGQPGRYGQQVRVDDDLLIFFTKDIK